jgi:hypothetical protein
MSQIFIGLLYLWLITGLSLVYLWLIGESICLRCACIRYFGMSWNPQIYSGPELPFLLLKVNEMISKNKLRTRFFLFTSVLILK